LNFIFLKSQIANRKSQIACILCILSFIPYFGCGSDPEEGEVVVPAESIRKGWEEYNAGNYGAAILAFEGALSESADPAPTAAEEADAYNGLGWVYLSFSKSAIVNQKNIATSMDKFQEALARNAAHADAQVGQAALLLIRRASQDDFRDALKAIDDSLQGKTEYLYRHDYDSLADLYALKAQCYYYLGEPDKACEELERVLAVEKNNSAALAIQKLTR
jgi:tetratricopeptide (TPR) repeat protein